MSNKLFIAEHFIRFCIFSSGWSNRTNLDTVANKQGRGKKGRGEGGEWRWWKMRKAHILCQGGLYNTSNQEREGGVTNEIFAWRSNRS